MSPWELVPLVLTVYQSPPHSPAWLGWACVHGSLCLAPWAAVQMVAAVHPGLALDHPGRRLGGTYYIRFLKFTCFLR